MTREAGKGDARRAGHGYQEGASRIWPQPPKHCPACGYLPSWCTCTDDGPEQPNADDATGIKKPLTP